MDIEARKLEIKKELSELRASAKSLGVDVGKDEAYAQGLIDKMFSEFKQGAKWVRETERHIREKMYAFSPYGRKRNLFAVLTGDRSIISAQIRRGGNAPIQGGSSEIGVVASRGVMRTYYKEEKKLRKRLALEKHQRKLNFNRIVHDANYFDSAYKMVIPLIHFMQYEASYGVAKFYKENIGTKFEVEPEIEIEIGARDDKTYAWDWSLPNLVGVLLAALEDAAELDLLDCTLEEAVAQTFAPHRDKKLRAYLQKHYPLLGVKDLDKQIENAERDYLQALKQAEDKADVYKRHSALLKASRKLKGAKNV